MSKTDTVSPLRQRMIDDMAARKLDPHTQRGHLSSCKRFAAWLGRSPDTATADEVRLFQLHLVESGASICNRNRIVTGVRFLFRVTLRRHDLAAEIWHMKEPLKLPPVLSPEEIKRVLNMSTSLKALAMLSLAYGCGLRASEVTRLRVCDIDSDQMIIRVVQSKGRKDRNVMLPSEILDLLRQWWKARPKRRDAGVAPERRWLFPGRHGPLTARQFGRLFKDAEQTVAKLKYDDNGLIPAVIVDVKTGHVLMVAYMNQTSLLRTIETGKTHFWSRSRKKYWMKGESSGHTQAVQSIYTDCDKDTLVIEVIQNTAACHEGYFSCFFRRLTPEGEWETIAKKVFDPDTDKGK